MLENIQPGSELKRLYSPPMKVYTPPKQKGKKCMTVAIGFISKKGIMLAADREITHANAKTRHKKIWAAEHGMVSVVATGCGTWGYLQSACQKVVSVVSAASSVADAADLVQEVVRKVFREEIEIDPARYTSEPPTFDLLVGVKTDEGLGLIRTEAATVRISKETEFLGAGGPLAERLCTACKGRALTKKQAVIILADAIRIVKESVSGCGGPTDIVSLEDTGKVEWEETKHLESVLDRIERFSKPYLLACADTDIDDERFEFLIGKLRSEGEKLREEERSRFP